MTSFFDPSRSSRAGTPTGVPAQNLNQSNIGPAHSGYLPPWSSGNPVARSPSSASYGHSRSMNDLRVAEYTHPGNANIVNNGLAPSDSTAFASQLVAPQNMPLHAPATPQWVAGVPNQGNITPYASSEGFPNQPVENPSFQQPVAFQNGALPSVPAYNPMLAGFPQIPQLVNFQSALPTMSQMQNPGPGQSLHANLLAARDDRYQTLTNDQKWMEWAYYFSTKSPELFNQTTLQRPWQPPAHNLPPAALESQRLQFEQALRALDANQPFSVSDLHNALTHPYDNMANIMATAALFLNRPQPVASPATYINSQFPTPFYPPLSAF